MQYEGTLYRPPSEARSLIIQATVGCSNNTCAFCSMYKQKKFHMKPIKEVLADFTEARAYYKIVDRIFIADGDALTLPMEDWKSILSCIREKYPECSRVSCYATPGSILRKKPEELADLRKNGLKLCYMGLESGSDQVLTMMRKGTTAQQAIEAAGKLRDAGIELSVTAINGLGGRELMEEHAVETGRVLSAMHPKYIGLLTLLVEPGTPLATMVKENRFHQLNADEVLQEIRMILQYTDSQGSIFRANHASNYLPLGGILNKDKEGLIGMIDQALSGKKQLSPDWMRGL